MMNYETREKVYEKKFVTFCKMFQISNEIFSNAKSLAPDRQHTSSGVRLFQICISNLWDFIFYEIAILTESIAQEKKIPCVHSIILNWAFMSESKSRISLHIKTWDRLHRGTISKKIDNFIQFPTRDTHLIEENSIWKASFFSHQALKV